MQGVHRVLILKLPFKFYFYDIHPPPHLTFFSILFHQVSSPSLCCFLPHCRGSAHADLIAWSDLSFFCFICPNPTQLRSTCPMKPAIFCVDLIDSGPLSCPQLNSLLLKQMWLHLTPTIVSMLQVSEHVHCPSSPLIFPQQLLCPLQI